MKGDGSNKHSGEYRHLHSADCGHTAITHGDHCDDHGPITRE